MSLAIKINNSRLDGLGLRGCDPQERICAILQPCLVGPESTLKKKGTWTTSVCKRCISCRCCSTVASDEEHWACHDNRSDLTGAIQKNRARVPHPNLAHIYIYMYTYIYIYTCWSVQSSSFPDGVTPSDFWSHSLLSIIMRHQHPSSKAISFECSTYYGCKGSSPGPYQTVPAFRRACPLTVAPGKKPRLWFPNTCKVKRPPQLHIGASPHLQGLLSQSFILVSFMFRSCIRWSMLSLTLTTQSRKHQCQLNHNCSIMIKFK